MRISALLASLVAIGSLCGCQESSGRAPDRKGKPMEPAQDAPLSEPPPLKWGPTVLRLARSGQIEEENETFALGDDREPHFLRPGMVPGWEVADATGKVLGGVRNGPALQITRRLLEVVLREGPLLSIDVESGEHYDSVGGFYFESSDCSGDGLRPTAGDSQDRGMPVLALGRVWVPVPTVRIFEKESVVHSKSTLDNDGRCQAEDNDLEPSYRYHRGPVVRWTLPLRLVRSEGD
jgi:hypothetical protein